jgi:hypothetical protein
MRNMRLSIFATLWLAWPLAAETIYSGRADVTIGYADAFGNLKGRQAFNYAVDVTVDAPARSGRIVERNPIHLVVAPSDDRQAGQNGVITIWSAMPLTDPKDGVQFLLQYWTLTLDATMLEGRLSNTHTAEAAALNLLNDIDELVPGRPELGMIPRVAALARGCTLRGTLTRSSIDIEIRGNVTDQSRPFIMRVRASR